MKKIFFLFLSVASLSAHAQSVEMVSFFKENDEVQFQKVLSITDNSVEQIHIAGLNFNSLKNQDLYVQLNFANKKITLPTTLNELSIGEAGDSVPMAMLTLEIDGSYFKQACNRYTQKILIMDKNKKILTSSDQVKLGVVCEN